MKNDNISEIKQLPPEAEKLSDRSSDHDEELGAASPEPRGAGESFGGESIAYPAIASPVGAAAGAPKKATPAPASRSMSSKALSTLSGRLPDRDKDILRALKKYRFLTTAQIERLFMTDTVNPLSRTRNTNRTMKKLREHGLAQPLERRIGGVRAGSSGLIWHLTERGYRLLALESGEASLRKRFEEPSRQFLEHTLTEAECAVQLHSLCRESEDMELVDIEAEPVCWRFFHDNGQACQLKPDLFVITKYDGVEDRWFMEIDLGTESPATVVEKCKTYRRYFYTGKEQEQNEVFPLVVWIVKDSARKERLRQYIRENLPPQPKMFIVITPEQLKPLIHQWLGMEELC